MDEFVRRNLGDLELSCNVATIFVDHRPEYIESICKALAASDAVALCASAHKLKGAAANLALPLLSETARMIESHAEAGDLEKAAELFQQLCDKLKPLPRSAYRGTSRFPLMPFPSTDPEVMGDLVDGELTEVPKPQEAPVAFAHLQHPPAQLVSLGERVEQAVPDPVRREGSPAGTDPIHRFRVRLPPIGVRDQCPHDLLRRVEHGALLTLDRRASGGDMRDGENPYP
jgi:pentatricopeptide repeat protein